MIREKPRGSILLDSADPTESRPGISLEFSERCLESADGDSA